jgi:hypothetical protein
MAEEEAAPRSNGDARARVAFDYIKGQFFRVVHADGVIGSVTPTGHIHMAIFSERPAIPRRLVMGIDKAGQPTEIIPNETVSRDSIIREIDVDVHMSLLSARSIQQWLDERIKELSTLLQTQGRVN